MYAVSDAYKLAIKSTNRTFSFKMVITLADTSTVTVTDDDIVQGLTSLDSSVMQDGSYAPGAAISADFGVTLISNTTLAAIDFSTTSLAPSVGLLLPDGTTEWVPLGIFYPDDISSNSGFIQVLAHDAMLKFDKPLPDNINWPEMTSTVLTAICKVCGVAQDTTSLYDDFYINSKPPCKTCRDLIQYIAAMNGCWATTNRVGKLVLSYPTSTVVESYDINNRYDFTPSQKAYGIKAITCNKKYYPARFNISHTDMGGDDDVYGITIDYTNNPLVQSSDQSLANDFDNIVAVTRCWPVVSGYESNWQGNPALDAGDVVQQTDRAGNVYTCLVARNLYYYRGNCTMSHEITVDNSSASLTEQVETVTQIVKDPTTAASIYAGLATYANNVYTAKLPGITALSDGFAVAFKVDTDCATPSLQIGSLTAKPIKQDTGDALDCHSGGMYEVRYNATNGNFILV